jgi:aspartate/methionine/tyrosine aminotransferase
MSIFDHLRKAANEIAQQAAARISNLDRQIAEIDEQKKKIETDRTKARGSLQRAANFPVKSGANYLCPSCWVDEGKMTPLNPIPSQTSDDIFICPLCSYETIIQQQR